ncbi:MAG: amino acid ABC transporter permease [Enterobacteriaceae bacterium]
MDFSVIFDNAPYILWGSYPQGPLGGAALTVLISIIAGAVSALVGTLLGICLLMFRGWGMALLTVILGFFRAIPVLMLIFWAYFLLPIVFSVDIPEVTTVICSLALISSAYLAHSVHAGLTAIGQGQWYAGLSLGLGRWQVLRYIILPQALRMMTPSFINQWIAMIKDSSLAYVIGVGELTFLAMQVNNRTMVYPAEIFLFIAAIYFILCVSLELLAFAVQRTRKNPI